jgi:hypothetical protein
MRDETGAFLSHYVTMRRLPSLAVLLLTLSAGCGDGDDGISDAESRALFESATAIIHQLHVDAFGGGAEPIIYGDACPGGGSISMMVERDGEGAVIALYHRLTSCDLDGPILNGRIDYTNIEPLSCGDAQGFALDIDGNVDVTGSAEGPCSILAREDCDGFTGEACGFPL